MNIQAIKKTIFDIIEPADESNVPGKIFDLSMVEPRPKKLTKNQTAEPVKLTEAKLQFPRS